MFTVRSRRKEERRKEQKRWKQTSLASMPGQQMERRMETDRQWGKRQRKIKQTQREREVSREGRLKQILVLYLQNLKGKELEYDSSDVTDHPLGEGKLPEKEKCRVEVSFMVLHRGQAPGLHWGRLQ